MHHIPYLQDERCRQYLLRLAAIVFSDYRYIKFMVEDCREDIDHLQCGRLRSGGSGVQQEGNQVNHSQGYTIECLTTQMRKLTPQCQKEILRWVYARFNHFWYHTLVITTLLSHKFETLMWCDHNDE